MGLRAIAAADNATILQDSVTGFGWPIQVTDPAGLTDELTGFGNDIALIIDPETGVAVSGRLASVALNIQELYDKGFALPEDVADESKKPWVIEFDDVNGNPFVFKVDQSNPDRGLGMITLILELYEK